MISHNDVKGQYHQNSGNTGLFVEGSKMLIFSYLRYKKVNWWKAFGKNLLDEGYLEEVACGTGVFGSTINISAKGESWMNEGNPDKILIYHVFMPPHQKIGGI